VVQALAPEAGDCNPQSTVQPPRITGPFLLRSSIFIFILFYFVQLFPSLQPLTDVLHERDGDRGETVIPLMLCVVYNLTVDAIFKPQAQPWIFFPRSSPRLTVHGSVGGTRARGEPSI
jgi:hypothetical protein